MPGLTPSRETPSPPAGRWGRPPGHSPQRETTTRAPGYVYWVTQDELRVMAARVVTELRRPLRAVPALRAVLGRYGATHPRELALSTSWLVRALADASEPGEAAAQARRVREPPERVASDRASGRAGVVLRRPAAFSHVPEVASLLAEGRAG
ncbi:hypothetical protein [Streptomyces sp. 7-21]|uniref:hypothetical protein n=1 Tax=Streptomyces sp. 7-21 TaxID=2802283 RepID=UPI00191CF2B9|nr:hypothetical protein [Streptomyces sp. 7-21]MBL1067701.1 hypothetical protein [Streptomyces sp. 7-21]